MGTMTNTPDKGQSARRVRGLPATACLVIVGIITALRHDTTFGLVAGIVIAACGLLASASIVRDARRSLK